MKKFVVSDIHGQGDIYFSIINYLEHLNEEVILYINGDVIDKGNDSIVILKDIIKRNNMAINLLAGNHELMMLQYLFSDEISRYFSDWFKGNNGGYETFSEFKKLTYSEKIDIISFLKKLKIVAKIDERIFDYYGIYISHANPIKNFDKHNCNLNDGISDFEIQDSLWYREDIFLKSKIGFKEYLNIVGHTPNFKIDGFQINNNVINIDGGAAAYPFINEEEKNIIHVPLIELDTFNNSVNVTSFDYHGDIFSESIITKEDNQYLIRKK